jgi:hypothetical protein
MAENVTYLRDYAQQRQVEIGARIPAMVRGSTCIVRHHIAFASLRPGDEVTIVADWGYDAVVVLTPRGERKAIPITALIVIPEVFG